MMVGVASTKPGSGTYLVNDTDALKKMMDARQMLEKYNWTEIQQARRVIEMGIIKLAAHNANRRIRSGCAMPCRSWTRREKRWKQMRKSMPI